MFCEHIYFDGWKPENMKVNWKGDSCQKYNVPGSVTGKFYG